MTVSSTTDRSGPYNGNGVTVEFAYEFRILEDTHITNIQASAAGVETVLTSADYTVAGVGDSGGGSITLDIAPATGETITIVRNAPFTQMTDLENQGAYFAETIERALDLAAMRDQQLSERLDRSVQIPISADASELDALVGDIVRLADSADEIDAVAAVADDVATVAGISADVSEVSAVAPVVTVVAGIASDVAAVGNIAANVSKKCVRRSRRCARPDGRDEKIVSILSAASAVLRWSGDGTRRSRTLTRGRSISF